MELQKTACVSQCKLTTLTFRGGGMRSSDLWEGVWPQTLVNHKNTQLNFALPHSHPESQDRTEAVSQTVNTFTDEMT